MDPFGSVPVHVRLLQQKPCPQAIRCEFGLVAIIDISGYSTLSSELEAILGPESGAKIKELINPPMERIIETVHSYDGSVVKFAGDAVIVSWCFPPTTLSTETLNFDAITDSDERSLTAKALSACVQLLIQFKDYKIWIGNSPRLLKIHIGLGLGEIDHIHIGSNQVSATIDQSNRREYFISGKALSLAGTFLNLGEKGDLVFSKTIESMLYQRFRKKGAYSCILSERDALEDILDEVSLYSFGAVSLGPCEDAAASAPRDDASFNHMLLYMDDAIRHHLAAPGKPRSLHLNDQIRSVSVVFIKFLEVHSESVAEPQNLDKIQAAMVAVIKECVEFQGSLRQFNCDDKSLTALLVWGLEGMAHEKGEHAFAVLAAKAIAKALDKFMKQEYAIGVTSGFALSGVVGSRCRYDHTILGVVVNNAARLMSLDQCHGIVLCDKDTYEATKESLTFKTDLPKVSIKGVNGQVEIFSPITSHIRESAAVNSVQRLYGRESEMSIIEKSIRNWRMGKNESKSANNLAIIGPSGLGKTQLISWFKTKASENGIVCNGACQEHKREGILFVFGSILRSLLEHLGKRQCKLLKKLEYAYTTKLAAKREQQRRSSMIPSTSSRLSDALHTAQPQPSDVSEAEGVGILSNVVVAFKDSRDQGLATPTNSGTIGKGKSVLAAKLNKIGLAAVIREEQKDEELERKTMELLVRVLTAISLPMSALEMLRIIPGISSQTFAQDSVLEGLAARLSAIIATLLNSISDAEIHISLCIDDVQWCDSHSLELLTHLVQKCPNTLFVIGARPFEEWKITLKDMAHQLLYSNNITVLNLQPLERHHVEQILKDTFQDYEFSSIEPQLLSHIMEKAQGSPLVTLILIRQLQKEKLFEVVDSIAKCSDYNLFAELVDKGVSSVVVAQLDKVNSTLRRILKVGALSAQRFSIADVLTVVRMIDSECELTTAAELVEFIRQSDTFDLIKISETEDEVHFSNYLIQQGVLSVMLATERQTIHLGFVELFEKKLERMDPKSPKTAPVRHLLLSHLMQIPGEDEKKRKHVYQAFLDAAEMRQTVEAFHYFDLYSSIKISEEPDKSCYKIVRECRLLAQLYYDKGEPAKAIQKTHEAFQALGCRRKYLIGTNLMLLLSACRLVKETEKVLQLENSAKREAAVRAFYSTTFPKAIVKMDAKIHPESNRASTDGQGDSNEFPFAEEIEALLWTAGSACLSFKPNVQGLLLSLLYLGPAMIAKSDRDFRLCRYLMGMSMSAYAFGFKKLSSICQQVGLPIMKELLQKDADTLTEYQSYLFVSALELSSQLSMMKSEYAEATNGFRLAYLYLAEKGLGSTEKAFYLNKNARQIQHLLGLHNQILFDWEVDIEVFQLDNEKFLRSETHLFRASSLCYIAEFQEAFEIYTQSVAFIHGDAISNIGKNRLLFTYVNCIRIIVCQDRVSSSDSHLVQQHLMDIDSCFANLSLKISIAKDVLVLLPIFIEWGLYLYERSKLNQNHHRSKVIEIIMFIKKLFVYPKNSAWTYAHGMSKAALAIWKNANLSTFIDLAQHSIVTAKKEGAIPDVQYTQILLRIWYAGMILQRDTSELLEKRRQNLRRKLLFEHDTGIDWEIMLLDSFLQSDV